MTLDDFKSLGKMCKAAWMPFKVRLKETKLAKDDCRYLHIVYNSSEMVVYFIGQVPTIGHIKTCKMCNQQSLNQIEGLPRFLIFICFGMFWHQGERNFNIGIA